jgi:hypothetical protein
MTDDLLFAGRVAGCVRVVGRRRLGPVLVLGIYGHRRTGRSAQGSDRISRVNVERRQLLHSLLKLSIRSREFNPDLDG